MIARYASPRPREALSARLDRAQLSSRSPSGAGQLTVTLHSQPEQFTRTALLASPRTGPCTRASIHVVEQFDPVSHRPFAGALQV